MSRGIVRPGRIGRKFRAKRGSPARSAFAAFLQLHENGFESVNNSFRGETSVGGVSAVEY